MFLTPELLESLIQNKVHNQEVFVNRWTENFDKIILKNQLILLKLTLEDEIKVKLFRYLLCIAILNSLALRSLYLMYRIFLLQQYFIYQKILFQMWCNYNDHGSYLTLFKYSVITLKYPLFFIIPIIQSRYVEYIQPCFNG